MKNVFKNCPPRISCYTILEYNFNFTVSNDYGHSCVTRARTGTWMEHTALMKSAVH